MVLSDTVSSAVCRFEKSHAVGQTVTVVAVTGRAVSTMSGNPGRNAPKIALTIVVAVTLTWHGSVPTHSAPLQPENTEPTAGVAVSVTTVS